MGRRCAFSTAASVAAIVVVLAAPCRAEEGVAHDGAGAVPAAPRLVLAPAAMHVFGGRTISRDAVGVDACVVVSRRVALGLAADLFVPFDPGDAPRGAAFPATQTFGAATLAVDVTVLGSRGGAAELYVHGGIGAVWTRPVSLVDPAHRRFSGTARLAPRSGRRRAGAPLPLRVARVRAP
jgi:hypothetical protein